MRRGGRSRRLKACPRVASTVWDARASQSIANGIARDIKDVFTTRPATVALPARHCQSDLPSPRKEARHGRDPHRTPASGSTLPATTSSTNYRGTSISLRLGQTTIEGAESRLQREVSRVELELARRAKGKLFGTQPARRGMKDCKPLNLITLLVRDQVAPASHPHIDQSTRPRKRSSSCRFHTSTRLNECASDGASVDKPRRFNDLRARDGGTVPQKNKGMLAITIANMPCFWWALSDSNTRPTD
jgi:hypothetical protein